MKAMRAVDCDVSDTVLIAAPEQLAILGTTRADFASALTFNDADTPAALDAIVRERPKVVAIERLFAATSRGRALITRIKADASLRDCQVRIVGGTPAEDEDATGRPAEASPHDHPLDPHGTRATTHITLRDELRITLDGNPAILIDVSLAGGQVSSAVALRPNQRVRVSLPAAARPLRMGAVVKWATLEMTKDGPRFRAGLEFPDADRAALAGFIEANQTQVE